VSVLKSFIFLHLSTQICLQTSDFTYTYNHPLKMSQWQSIKWGREKLCSQLLKIRTKFTPHTWSCPFKELKSSAFFSKDWTQTFLFCRHLEAAALFRSRNFLLFSSGSSLAALLRRPLVLWVCGVVWAGEAYIKHKWKLVLCVFSTVTVNFFNAYFHLGRTMKKMKII
jgi:hypothetical protein